MRATDCLFWTFVVIASGDAAFRGAKCRWSSLCTREDFRLDGHHIATKRVESLLSCGHLCMAHDFCQSVNFLKASGECDLQSATSAQFPMHYVAAPGYVYIGADSCFNKNMGPTNDNEKCVSGSCSICGNKRPETGCSPRGENILSSWISVVTLNVLPNDGSPKGYIYGSDAVIADGDTGTCALAQNGTHMGWAITLSGEVNVKTVALRADKYEGNYGVYTYPEAGTPMSTCSEWQGTPGPDDCNGWLFIECASAVAAKYIVVQTAMPTITSTISMCEIAAYQ